MTQTQPFVTAEETINPGRGVWVQLDTLAVRLADGALVTHSFVITTSTGYRATLPVCICERTPCMKSHDMREHCHGTSYGRHIEHARAFAIEVGKTYGSAKRSTGPKLINSRISRVHNVTVREWSEGDWAQRMERLV